MWIHSGRKMCTAHVDLWAHFPPNFTEICAQISITLTSKQAKRTENIIGMEEG